MQFASVYWTENVCLRQFSQFRICRVCCASVSLCVRKVISAKADPKEQEKKQQKENRNKSNSIICFYYLVLVHQDGWRNSAHNAVRAQYRLSYSHIVWALGGDAQGFARQCHQQSSLEHPAGAQAQHAGRDSNLGVLEVSCPSPPNPFALVLTQSSNIHFPIVRVVYCSALRL